MIVTDSGCSFQCTGDVCFMHDVALFGAVTPDAGETIGLQLKIYGERVLLTLVLLGKHPHALFDSQKLLYVMAQFMRDDIGLREVGLGLVDRLPALKHLFIREAAGLVGEVPKLLRGEAL